MPRRLRLPSDEKGILEVLVIRSKDGVWEGDWHLLKGTVIGNLFSQTTQPQLDHILSGYSKPFVNELGISPEGALRKLPSRECKNRKKCPFYDVKKCQTLTRKILPWCFEPEGLDDLAKVSAMVAEVIFKWREGVYLVVVENPNG